MRDFFIRGLEILVGIVISLMALAIVIAAAAAMLGQAPPMGPGAPALNGPVAGLLILLGGFIYLVFVGGVMYLGLGIYQNTKRTVELLEARRL
ncbi:MAG: hypothetical protein H5U20_04025 [Rhodobacteraceae bacterium]|nr:hypothetical protein [Paracoccaceae bacterium]